MATNATVTSRQSKGPNSSKKVQDGRPPKVQPASQFGNLALILASLQTMRDGDFSVRLPVAWVGVEGKIADIFNDIVAANEQMAAELNRVGLAVGKRERLESGLAFNNLEAPGVRWKAPSIPWSRIC
jgi:hypothetical protein